ncbi:MAG: hypothetical protein RR066_07045 [Mucinivorans sp.]
MKKLFFLALCIAFMGSAVAQLKTIETSQKKAPAWLYGTSDGYIIVTEQASTVDQAKAKAMESVKRQIIEAVALNLKSDYESRMHQTSGAGEQITQFEETSESKFATRAARLPFVKGISANKVKEFYWEKQFDRKTRETLWGYSILYPFSKGELYKLITDFTKQDNEIMAKLLQAEDVAENFTSTEQLDKVAGEIPQLEEWFFDDMRLKRTSALKSNIQRQYSYIKPVIATTKKGEARLTLVVGNRLISTSVKPTIKSNCAMEINYITDKEGSLISYDDQGCLKNEPNFLEVTFRLAGATVKDKLFFDVNAQKVELSLKGIISFEFIKNASSDTLSGVKITLTLAAANDNPATLEGVNLSIGELEAPVIINNIGENISGSGDHVLTLNGNGVFVLGSSHDMLSMVKGYLYVRNGVNGALLSVPIASSYKIY